MLIKNKYRRIFAVLYRHYSYLRRTPLQLLDMIIGPSMGVLVWGGMSSYLRIRSNSDSSLHVAFELIVAGYLLWEILIRSQSYILKNLMEEVLARNLGYLLVSPVRDSEVIISLIIISIIMTLFSAAPAGMLASILFINGMHSIMCFCLVLLILSIIGWSFGLLISATVLRFGRPAEVLNGLLVVILAPISCVFYPPSILPEVVQTIARTLPTTNAFEALRIFSAGKQGGMTYLIYSIIGVAVLFPISIAVFSISIRWYRFSGKALSQ